MAMEVFPDVYVRIQDNSFYVNPLPGTVAFIAFASERGEDNKLILSNGPNFLLNEFGKPNKAKYGEGLYVAHKFNSYSANLYVMRVLPNDAAYADAIITYDHATTTLALTSANDFYALSDIETAIGNTTNLAIFYSKARGQWYNNIAINLTPSVNVENAYDLDVYAISDMGNQILVETFVISFDKDAIDYQGDPLYAPYVLDRYSQYVRCMINDSTVEQAMADGVTDFSTVFTSVTNFAGGSDGSLFDATGALDWTVLTQQLVEAYSGLKDTKVIDTEFTYFNLIFDAGYPSDVKDAIQGLAQLRGDAVGILDLGDNSTAADALNARQMTYTYNTYFVALYEMYSKIYDQFNGYDIWITPVYHMAEVIPKTDRNYGSFWEPPAGLKKGMVTLKETRYDVMGGYKTQFVLNQINFIGHFVQGYAIWGESTSQNLASKMQELHITRLVLWIKRALRDKLRWFIWDLNTDLARESIRQATQEFMNSMVPEPIESVSVNVYSTEYDKKLGRVRVEIQMKPIGAIKIIDVTIFVQ